MDFLTLAKERYSVRKFDGRPLSDTDVEKILEAGISAPTAKNIQPHRIYVVKSEEGIRKINECSPCIYGSKTVFIICYDKTECWCAGDGTRNSGEIDSTIVATQMMLEATDIGAGTTMLLRYDRAMLRECFKLPENIVDVCLLTAGYPAEDAEPSPRHTERKAIDEIVKFI